MRSRSDRYQIAGLIGFIISGVLFLSSGIRSGDVLTILGCVAWIFACGIWLIPLLGPGSE